MSGAVPVVPRFRFDDAPLGSVTVYAAGTTTKVNTYQDAALTTLNTNPVNLDAKGECLFLTDGTTLLKFLVTTGPNGTGSTVSGYPVDNIPANATSNIVAGTGGVVRSLQDKMREHISVFDYIDDTQKAYILARDSANINSATVRAAVQACFDAVASGAPLKTRRIYFPGGLYLFDQYLWLYSCLELFGDGAATVLRNVNSGSVSNTYQGVFAQGYYASPGVDDVGAECTNNAYACSAMAAGDSSFTLTVAANAANFAVDRIVFIHNGVEKQYGASQAKTREELECRRVTGVNAGTGVISLDRPVEWAHGTCYATISGKAGIRGGLNEPTNHKYQILDRLYIHDLRIEWRNFNGLPGSVYDSVFERIESDGPFGYSVNFAFNTAVRNNSFTCAIKGIELAMSNGNSAENNAISMDSSRVYDSTATTYYGLLTTQGSRNNSMSHNRLFAAVEVQPVFDGGSGLFGATQDNTFADNYCVRTATTTAQSFGDITLANSANARALRNTFVGGNKFHHNLNAATGFEVSGNKHVAQIITPEQAHTFQASGAGCSGYISNNVHEGALSFDLNGIASTVTAVYVDGNEYRGSVTTKSTHPNFSGATYGRQKSWVKASSTFTASDTTEQTIFSHTIAALEKSYSRWDAEFWMNDTMIPAADKTLKMYDGATLLGTLTLPSAFGRARTQVELQVSSVNDSSVRFVLRVTQFPFSAPGAASVLGFITTVSTTSSTSHQPKVTATGPVNSTFSVTGVQLRRTGNGGGPWTA